MGNIQLKVLHLGAKNYPPNHGGTERLVYDLVTGMPEVESHVFVEWEHDHDLPRVRKMPKGIIAKWKTISNYIHKNNIDIVHVHKSSNIPLALLLKFSGFKCILTVHGCVWRRREARWSVLTKMVFWVLDLTACIFLDKVVLVGEHDWMSFSAFFPKRRLCLIRNGVPVDREQTSRHRSGWAYLGRISPEKNILGLIAATKALSEKLVLYGPISPPNACFTKAFKRELEKSNVEWRGPIRSREVRATLARHKVFINPSFTEGLPFTVLEAAAEGLYLVLSDIRPHRLLNFPECNYIDPCDLDLSHLSSNVLNGAANRTHAANNFSIERMLEGYLEIYKSLIKTGVAPG
jgi:glycosyltransferase involved in cell wall biosynthesis